MNKILGLILVRLRFTRVVAVRGWRDAGSCRERQREPERGAAAGVALGRNPPAVRLDDVLHDRQPQPRAAVARLARRAEELLEHPPDVLPGDPGAVVTDD